MRRVISSFLLICILSVVMPANSGAIEVQKVKMTQSEISSLNLIDTGELDNMTGGGKTGETIIIIIGVTWFVLVVGTALINLAGGA